jgi:hypothetical protein
MPRRRDCLHAIPTGRIEPLAATRHATLDTAPRVAAFQKETTMSRFHALAAAAAALLAAAHPALQAQPDPSLADVPLARLQAMVRHCDPHPDDQDAPSFSASFCAFAADELRRRESAGPADEPADARREASTRVQVNATAASKRSLPGATPQQLKSVFMQCDRLSRTTVLDFGTAAQCSVVYEELKQRVFEGDSERLLAWWRDQSKVTAAQDTARASP